MTRPHAGRTGSARPHERYTPDGRRVREVVSYARRSARLTERQHRAWEAHSDAWVVDSLAVELGETSWAEVFGREAPLVVEIGSGVGEATAAYAAAHPEHDVLAIEVWRPGVADLLHRVAEVGASNVRVVERDAVDCLEHVIREASVHELWTFFPDPWPKSRHHKRRLISEVFAEHVARALAPGGVWRLATDWPPYAERMREVLDASDALVGGEVARWDGRPLTKFERRGLAAGRPVVDLAYTVRDSRA